MAGRVALAAIDLAELARLALAREAEPALRLGGARRETRPATDARGAYSNHHLCFVTHRPVAAGPVTTGGRVVAVAEAADDADASPVAGSCVRDRRQAHAVEGRGLDHRVVGHVERTRACRRSRAARSKRVVADHVAGEAGQAAEPVGVRLLAGLAGADDLRAVRHLEHVGHVRRGRGVEDRDRACRCRRRRAPWRPARRCRARSPRPARGRPRTPQRVAEVARRARRGARRRSRDA